LLPPETSTLNGHRPQGHGQQSTEDNSTVQSSHFTSVFSDRITRWQASSSPSLI